MSAPRAGRFSHPPSLSLSYAHGFCKPNESCKSGSDASPRARLPQLGKRPPAQPRPNPASQRASRAPGPVPSMHFCDVSHVRIIAKAERTNGRAGEGWMWVRRESGRGRKKSYSRGRDRGGGGDWHAESSRPAEQ